MFFSEFCCLLAYLYFRYRRNNPWPSPEEKSAAIASGQTLHYTPLWFCLPAFLDIFAGTLAYVGLLRADASVAQLTGCTILVWVAVFSCIFLKRRYETFQYVGLAALSLGVMIVSFNTFWTGAGEEAEPGNNSPFGVGCLIVSSAITGFMMVAEEMLMTRFCVHPLMVVGMEGTAGLGIYSIALMVMYFTPCVTNPDTCPYGRVEDVPHALHEIASSPLLVIIIIASILSLSLYNFVGLSLTKWASATHRGAVIVATPFVVWAVCLAINWEQFFFLELAGYLVAVYGIMLYYEMIPLKIWTIWSWKAGKKTEESSESVATEPLSVQR